MNLKEYFRQLVLHDFGYPLDGKFLELKTFMVDNFSNLIIYDESMTYIYYHNSKNENVFRYHKSAKYYTIHDTIIMKLKYHFDIYPPNTSEIICYYIKNFVGINIGEYYIENY